MAGHPTHHVNVIKIIKMRDYMDRRVTSPTWGSLKQALICYFIPMLLFDQCNYCIECILLLGVNKQLKLQHIL